MSRPGAAENPIVLRYHSVGGSAWLRPKLVVSAEHFAAQLRHLRRHHRVLPVETLLALTERGERPPPGPVAITFDDGYGTITTSPGRSSAVRGARPRSS